MSKVEDVIDDHFLSLIEEAEADAIAAGGIIKRPKLSDATSGGGGRQENQEEGSYMAALRGSRSSLWQRQQNDLNLLKKDSGGSGLGSRSSAATPSSTLAAGACFKCGMTGHWARDCGGAQAGSADHTDGLAPSMPCLCGAGTCLVLTSNTAKNPGRLFYRCPLKAENGGCNYFEWCDSPSSGITVYGQSNSEVPVLHCPCGAGSCLILVCKSGKNEGQQYYKCPGNEGRGSCGFFKWCCELGSVPRQSSFSQQFHGSFSVSKSQSSVDKTNSSCFKCGQEGHWAKDCQNQPSNSSLVGGISQPSFAGSGSGSTTGTCFKCGKSGHWARDCPAQNSYSSSGAAAAAYGKRNSGSQNSHVYSM
ncbi:hypothetical protein KSP40_PGU017443 [Platanthera guangdongensis]|uniref:Uncharacterized protein n=1 Tax=Platanthera guangdongensis TaxID=2320717 RepID=A0ABR2MX91_9ASPA